MCELTTVETGLILWGVFSAGFIGYMSIWLLVARKR